MSETKTKKKKKNKSKILTITKFTILTILLAGFIGVGALTGLVASYLKDEPVRSEEEIKNTVFSNDLTGYAYFSNTNESGDPKLIGMLRADQDRQVVKYDDISPHLFHAVMAIEDREFLNHHGVNFTATLRAVLQQITNSDVQTGGSTITQQLAKTAFFTLDRTYERKVREMFLALRIEKFMSKKDIFTAYINKINFGTGANLNNVYGIQAAAKGYFNKNAIDLNIAESAYLAGIPQRPNGYSAFYGGEFNEDAYNRAIKRQKQILNGMLSEGYISQSEYDEALEYDIKTAFAYNEGTSKRLAYNSYPFLMLEIEDRAAEQMVKATGLTPDDPDYDNEVKSIKQTILTGGYKVYTTIDKDVYEAMNKVAKNPDNFAEPKNYKFKFDEETTVELTNQLVQIGATLIDNKTGGILGFVGGRDFSVSQVNHSNFRSTSKRQSGSTIKPILEYAPALELGYISPATPIDDIPLKGNWEPSNWNEIYNGRMSARVALKRSFNIPAVKVYEMVGQNKGYEYYTKVGLEVKETFFKQANLTAAIGSIETSPERLTTAYTTFANGGTYIDSYLIDRIEDIDGNVVYQHQAEPVVVYSEQTAYLMTDMMRSVVSEAQGTGLGVRNYINYNYDIAAKTGTTNEEKDSWIVGYTPRVTLGIWAGYDYPITLYPASVATTAWGRMLKEVMEVKPELVPANEKFKRPNNLVQMEVSTSSGTLPSELTKEAGYLVTDWFNKKYIPTETDDTLQKARVVTYDDVRYIAKSETPDDMVESGIYYKREPYTIPKPEPGEKPKPKPSDYDKELPNEVDPRQTTGTVLAPPENILFKDLADKKILSWDKNPNPNVAGYRIYRYSLLDSGFKYIGATLQKNTDTTENKIRTYYEDVGTANKSYIYYITTVDIAGNESIPSVYVGNKSINPPIIDDEDAEGDTDGADDNIDNNTDIPDTANLPSIPSNLIAEHQIINTGVKLSWTPNPLTDAVINYNVYYSTQKNSSFSLAGSSSGSTFMHDIAITGKTYYYITAVNSNGESNPSNIIEVKK